MGSVRIALLLAALLSAHSAFGASELETLAAKMKPGEWAELKTKNFGRKLLDTPGSFITAFSDDAVWNPRRNELYFLGAGHGDQSTGEQTRFIRYSAADNSWGVIQLPAALYGIGHSYDHNAIDPATGAFYHRVYNTREVHKYDPVAGAWDALPLWPSGHYLSAAGGLEYFPEMHGLVYFNGSGKDSNGGYVMYFNSRNGKWSLLREGLHFGLYHGFSEYNPVHRVVLFGGGEWYQQGESREMYKLDAAGKVSKLKDAPLDLGTHETVFTVDPVSGKYLVFGRDRGFWEHDVESDSWKKLESRVPFFSDNSRDNPVQGTIASPIGNHGVVMFVSYHANKVYLYKHH